MLKTRVFSVFASADQAFASFDSTKCAHHCGPMHAARACRARLPCHACSNFLPTCYRRALVRCAICHDVSSVVLCHDAGGCLRRRTGDISWDEWKEALRDEGDEGVLRECFEQMDADGDGRS